MRACRPSTRSDRPSDLFRAAGARLTTALAALVLAAGCAASPRRLARPMPAATPAPARGPVRADADLAPDAAALFAWADGLGLPDTAEAPLVRVNHGYSSLDGQRWWYGFLLEATADRWVVLYDLEPETYPREAIEVVRGLTEMRDFAREVPRILARGNASPIGPGREACRDGGTCRGYEAPGATLEWFLLARAAARRGLWPEANALFARAVASAPFARADQPDGRSHAVQATEMLRRVAGVADAGRGDATLLALVREAPDPLTPRARLALFLAVLRRSLARALYYRALFAFADPAVSRATLLRRFRLLAERLPETPEGREARDAAAVLEGMLAEDAAHERAPSTPPATVQDVVRELVFALRDYPTALSRGNRAAAYGSLVLLGDAAVPALLEILEDRRFTRVAGYLGGLYGGYGARPGIERYGDVAREMLRSITGVWFHSRAEADAWWASHCSAPNAPTAGCAARP